jgi:hypothetical protein
MKLKWPSADKRLIAAGSLSSDEWFPVTNPELSVGALVRESHITILQRVLIQDEKNTKKPAK